MSVIHTPEEKPLDAKALVLPVCLGLFFLGFIYRLWDLQIARHEQYREAALRTFTVEDATLPVRGQIVDRNGVEMASIQPSYVAYARYDLVSRDKTLLPRLAAVTGLDLEDLKRNLKRYGPDHRLLAPIAPDLTPEQAALLAESDLAQSGVTVELRPMRSYADPVALSHVLGYVGPRVSAKPNLAKTDDVEQPDFVGRTGLEKQYDSALSGRNGKVSFFADPLRRPTKLKETEDPIAGSRVVSTLDFGLQKLATKLMNGSVGSLVALDVRTGDILSMVSSPSFDVRARWGGDEEAIADLEEKADLSPELFRPLKSRKAPGSTFKVVTAMAAELSGKFHPERTLTCPGYFVMSGTQKLRCENHPPGATLDFHGALSASCNSYFATMAKSLTTEELFSAYEKLGLTTKTGIDFPTDSSGMHLTVESFGHKPPSVFDADRAQLGIGQSKISVTPLQMAMISSLIANKGWEPVPRLVREIDGTIDGSIHKFQPKKRIQVALSSSFWDTLWLAMEAVISQGTARTAKLNVVWAGKTGSAEERKDKPTHAWFIAFGPIPNPEVAICVMVENGGHGGVTAAPIAATWMQKYLDGKSHSTTKPDEPAVEIATPDASPTD